MNSCLFRRDARRKFRIKRQPALIAISDEIETLPDVLRYAQVINDPFGRFRSVLANRQEHFSGNRANAYRRIHWAYIEPLADQTKVFKLIVKRLFKPLGYHPTGNGNRAHQL
ncbi:hypothetical protein CQ12_38180 [Bradyrhizobium jicamae]|uniref:Uncharacterized protein n=1 Tax=Bradyrhizobium jicamae TaxID=280332 RepID=A0A0R3KQD4_9BRAD|nr:hypothetical protein CQ12_38180 [Bradyrhizobium jicamae]